MSWYIITSRYSYGQLLLNNLFSKIDTTLYGKNEIFLAWQSLGIKFFHEMRI